MARIAFLIIGAGFLAGCNGSKTEATPTVDVNKPAAVVTPQAKLKKLEITDSKPGAGKPAVNGDRIYVMYRGKLANGTQFDTNMDNTDNGRGGATPYVLILGAPGVIKGWSLGLVGAKTGMERRLGVPAELGYGAGGSGEKIPPNADLFFDLKVLYVLKKEDHDLITAKDMVKGTGATVAEGKSVTISYVGKLLNDKQFEKFDKLEQNYSKLISVIKDGMAGMKAGGKRRIVVPPGTPGIPYGLIPGDQMAVYEIELISVK